jgi:cytochrome c2
MRLSLAIASFVVLIVHGVVFYDQFFHRWERHQTAYFEQARSLSKNEQDRAELEARSPRIEQSIVTSFGDTRMDRCTTCHIASDDPRFTITRSRSKPPYSAAMGDVQCNGLGTPPLFADFGRTVCHDGQGRGLKPNSATAKMNSGLNRSPATSPRPPGAKISFPSSKARNTWRPLRPVPHGGKFAGTPNVNRGRKLFYGMNCYGCHKIDGMMRAPGPDLTEAGKKFSRLPVESIAEPRANLGQLHAEVHLPEADVRPW